MSKISSADLEKAYLFVKDGLRLYRWHRSVDGGGSEVSPEILPKRKYDAVEYWESDVTIEEWEKEVGKLIPDGLP